MNSKDLLEAFGYVDDRYLDKVDFSDKEDIIMTNNTNKKTGKKAAIILAAAALFTVMTASVYAQNLWGIREIMPFTNADRAQMSEEAASQIQAQGIEYNGDGWTCCVTETLFDANNAIALVDFKSDGRYIFVPVDYCLDDPSSCYGFDTEGASTIGEYAQAHGKELMAVNAYLSCEEGILSNGEMNHIKCSDNEMMVLTKYVKDAPTKLEKAVCTVYANGEKIEIPLNVTESDAKAVGIYAPKDSRTIPGIVAGSATVTETELGVTVRFAVEVENDEARFEAFPAKCDKTESFVQGGYVMDENGNWNAKLVLAPCDMGDEFTLTFIDSEKNPVGEIVFTK